MREGERKEVKYEYERLKGRIKLTGVVKECRKDEGKNCENVIETGGETLKKEWPT